MTTRSGPPVEVFEFTEPGASVSFLADALARLGREEPLASVAVLTPSPAMSDLYTAVREALEAHAGSSSTSRVCQRISRSGVAAGVQRAGPAVGCPAGRLVEAPPRRASASGSQTCSSRHHPWTGRGRPPRRAAGCRDRGVPSGAPPAAWTAPTSVPRGPAPRRRPARPVRRRRSRRPSSAPARRARRGAGVGGSAIAARQVAVAAASSQSSSTAVGSTRPVRRPPGDRPGSARSRRRPPAGPGAPRRRRAGERGGTAPRGSPGQRRRAAAVANVVPAEAGSAAVSASAPSGCPPAWPGASRWPRRGSPIRGRDRRSSAPGSCGG